ncbi:MAG: hypothetical protein ACO3JG_01335 [Luteolibacter sp.]
MYRVDNPGWDMHRRMRNPMQDLGIFMHGCSEDPVTRVMATTAVVLALCQTAGPTMVSQPPGFLLLHAGDEPVDPIDAVMKTLVGMIPPTPRPESETFERNRRVMKSALLQKLLSAEQARTMMDFFGLQERERCPLVEAFQNAMTENHGQGRAGWYADRCDEEFGWVTDATGHSIMRLDREEDLQRFREDLRMNPAQLIHPTGYGADMRQETKRLSIAGSVSVADWDDHLANGIVCNALPVLFLPHAACEPLVTPGELAMEWIGIALAGEAVESTATPVEAYERLDLIKPSWVKERINRLRERLHHFPADYEFFVMRSVRELLPCCRRLVGITAPAGSPEEEQLNLTFDLFSYVLQGVCLGVEALGWHGYGFESRGETDGMRRVLRAIREHGSLSRRDLQRHQQWLTAATRDEILGALTREGLIMIAGNEITVRPFADYWRHILRRAFNGLPEPLWQGAPCRQHAAAAS